MGTLDINARWIPVEVEPGQSYKYPSKVSRHIREKYGKPCVYRWALFKQEAAKPYMVYVGEGENLVSRLQGYLSPGPTQSTNLRIKQRLEGELKQGSRVELHTLTFEPIHLLIDKEADEHELIAMHRLGHPFIRKMMENVGILLHDVRYTEILNRALNPMERRRDKARKLK